MPALSNLDLIGLLLASLFGFLVGALQRQRQRQMATADQELRRAQTIVRDFERIAIHLRQAVQQHQRSVMKFKDRVNTAATGRRDVNWDELSVEMEGILKPTLALADEVARAYDQIRQQSNLLLNMHESRLDPLTGVGNRRTLNESLETQFSLQRRYGTPASIVLIDIDHFKQINDTKGHLYGDQVLTKLAQMLSGLIREVDAVTRYGGEEFVVVLPETELPGAEEFAERTRLAIQYELSITVSIGVASLGDAADPATLVEAADRALYEAKRSGRNRAYATDSNGIHRIEPRCQEGDTAADVLVVTQQSA